MPTTEERLTIGETHRSDQPEEQNSNHTVISLGGISGVGLLGLHKEIIIAVISDISIKRFTLKSQIVRVFAKYFYLTPVEIRWKKTHAYLSSKWPWRFRRLRG